MWVCVDILFVRELVCVSDIDVGHDSFRVRAVTCVDMCASCDVFMCI